MSTVSQPRSVVKAEKKKGDDAYWSFVHYKFSAKDIKHEAKELIKLLNKPNKSQEETNKYWQHVFYLQSAVISRSKRKRFEPPETFTSATSVEAVLGIFGIDQKPNKQKPRKGNKQTGSDVQTEEKPADDQPKEENQ